MLRQLTQDVFSQTLNSLGHAVVEGYLPKGTVVEWTTIETDDSMWTGAPRGNRGEGIPVRIVRTADGQDGTGLARELLCVDTIDEVSVPVSV